MAPSPRPTAPALSPPGAFAPPRDRWGRFPTLASRLPKGALVLIDRRVAKLHPGLLPALRERSPAALIALKAGESAKTMTTLEQVLARATLVPRSATLLAIGGGTLGDLATVAAHLHKRGIRLVHVPSTLLAAVDSSLGGKGAVHLGASRAPVKNAAGVFHYPAECWICPELFTTLSPAQLREGALEAWKMVASLDAAMWRRYRRGQPPLEALLRDARQLKARVCEADPYEQLGERRVLNFGHTFGHVLESLSRFRLSHGDAVGLGMLCALDIGRAFNVTPPAVAEEVERGLLEGPMKPDAAAGRRGGPGRAELAKLLARVDQSEVEALLRADKKAIEASAVTMVLLTAIGRATVVQVPNPAWKRALIQWRRGERP